MGGVVLGLVFFVSPLVCGADIGVETSNQIVNRVQELKDSLVQLEQVRGGEKNQINIEKEKIARQMALFKIIEISLLENTQMLETVRQLTDADIVVGVVKSLEEDNKKYQKFIMQVNLASSSESLKETAKDIKDYRQNKDGLTIRRLLGMVFVFQEFKSIQAEKERLLEAYDFLNSMDDLIQNDLKFWLIAADKELDTAYQLAISSQMRLAEINNFEDFSYINDWLARANKSINLSRQIFDSFSKRIQ